MTDPTQGQPDPTQRQRGQRQRGAGRSDPSPGQRLHGVTRRRFDQDREQAQPVRGRMALLIVVIVVAVVVGFVGSGTTAPSEGVTPGAPDGASIPSPDSAASALFCAGGASGFDGLAGTTIYLTNTNDKMVEGTMISRVAPGTGSGAASTGSPVSPNLSHLVLPAGETLAVNAGTGLPAGDVATSFVFAGGGVAAEQVVSGSHGWSMAPCASQTATSWYFAGGSTVAGDAMTLDLFNPTSTGAMVNVSFLTDAGVIDPSKYQGVVVPAGQIVAENVGDFVQNHPDIATVVSAESSAIVAYELQRRSTAASGLALELGSPSPATVWHFAQTTNPARGTVTFDLANPGTTAAVATLSIGLAAAASVTPIQVAIPAQSVVAFVASQARRILAEVPYSVTVRSSAGIVVSRAVQAATGSNPPIWGASSGTAVVASHWLVPAPGAGTAPGMPGATVASLGVENPGPKPVRVLITAAGTRTVISSFTVAAGSLAVLGPNLVGGLQTFEVVATQPVAVEEDDDPSGAPGVVSSTGISFSG